MLVKLNNENLNISLLFILAHSVFVKQTSKLDLSITLSIKIHSFQYPVKNGRRLIFGCILCNLNNILPGEKKHQNLNNLQESILALSDKDVGIHNKTK